VHISSAQRYALNFLLTDGRPERSALGLQWRCLSRNNYAFSNTTYLQRCVYTGSNVHLNLHPVLSEALEPGHLDINTVQTSIQIREGECAPTPGLCGSSLISSQVGDFYVSA